MCKENIERALSLLGPRRKSRSVQVGGLLLGGGGAPIVQSMNNCDSRDVEASLAQIHALAAAGCQLTRLAIPDQEAAEALGAIARRSPLPIVADIHFDYRLALAALENGAAKIRINPGNIGGAERLRQVVRACQERQVPIRVGVNSGSISRALREAHGGVNVESLCASALEALRLIEDCGYDQLVVSLKASDPALCIAAYRRMAELCDYPLHLGVTEAGTQATGSLRSAVALGALLAEGIGDTLRVSLTADPVEEVHAAYTILKALGLARQGSTVISCPTCGRTQVDLIALAARVEEALKSWAKPLTVAVMGCAVNGPGEAREADIGIAGGRGEYVLFVKGKIIAKVPEEQAFERLMAEIGERFGAEV